MLITHFGQVVNQNGVCDLATLPETSRWNHSIDGGTEKTQDTALRSLSFTRYRYINVKLLQEFMAWPSSLLPLSSLLGKSVETCHTSRNIQKFLEALHLDGFSPAPETGDLRFVFKMLPPVQPSCCYFSTHQGSHAARRNTETGDTPHVTNSLRIRISVRHFPEDPIVHKLTRIWSDFRH